MTRPIPLPLSITGLFSTGSHHCPSPLPAGFALVPLGSLKGKRQKYLENPPLSSKTGLRAHYLTVSSVPTLNIS